MLLPVQPGLPACCFDLFTSSSRRAAQCSTRYHRLAATLHSIWDITFNIWFVYYEKIQNKKEASGQGRSPSRGLLFGTRPCINIIFHNFLGAKCNSISLKVHYPLVNTLTSQPQLATSANKGKTLSLDGDFLYWVRTKKLGMIWVIRSGQQTVKGGQERRRWHLWCQSDAKVMSTCQTYLTIKLCRTRARPVKGRSTYFVETF